MKKYKLFRVLYRITTETENGAGLHIGQRKTVVANELQEAIDKVLAYEHKRSPAAEIVINEVMRENIEVWR